MIHDFPYAESDLIHCRFYIISFEQQLLNAYLC